MASTFDLDSLDDEIFEALVGAMPGDAGEKDLRRSISLTKARTLLDVYTIASQAATIEHGGKGALFNVEKGLKALFFAAFVVDETLITEQVQKSAEELLIKAIGSELKAKDAMQEVFEYALTDRMPMFRVLDRYNDSRPQLQALHQSYQHYYVALAIKDFAWTLPEVPWRLSARWAPVLSFGAELGNAFWQGLLLAAPSPGERDPRNALLQAVHIRDAVGGDRPTSLLALGGLLRGYSTAKLDWPTTLDWSEICLEADACSAMFKPFGKDTLPKLTKLFLNDNPIDEVGVRSFSDALLRGAMPSLEELRLSNAMLGDAGIKALSAALLGGSLPWLKQLYLNYNEIGDDGTVAFSEAVTPSKDRPSGALQHLEVLTLANNNVGSVGVRALAAACDAGGLGNLQRLLFARNPAGSATMINDAIVRARKPRPRKVVPLFRWEDVGLAAITPLSPIQSSGKLRRQGAETPELVTP